MDNKTISDKNVFGHIQVVNEIKRAKEEERPADFSNKTVDDFSVLPDKIRFGLNLENALISNPLFIGKSIIEGDVNLRNAKINGSLYLGKSEISGDLILENARISGTVNLIGIKVIKSVKAHGLVNTGFLSLSKAEIGKDVDLEGAEIKDVNYSNTVIRGDLILDSAVIKGSLNISKIRIGGMIDLDGISINKDLIITGAKARNKIDTSTAFIMGRKII